MSTNLADLPFNPAASAPPPQPPKTALPERDIPRETMQHAVDPQSIPSYMPPKAPEYLGPMQQYHAPVSRFDYATIMEDLKIPVLLSVLFFAFNLSSVQNFLIRMIPSIQDSSNSALIKSALFGLSYFAVQRAMEHFNLP